MCVCVCVCDDASFLALKEEEEGRKEEATENGKKGHRDAERKSEETNDNQTHKQREGFAMR